MRDRPVERGARRGRQLLATVLREADDARVDRGLSHAAIGRAVGLSPQQVGRMLGGRVADLGIVRASTILATVGLELSARTFPAGPPIRDAAQVALLERLRHRIADSLRWRTEVPVIGRPVGGGFDQPAWDAAIDGPGWSIRVEAETRASDVQALQRRIALKQRDGAVRAVILLLADTRHNRAWLREAGLGLREQFPVSPRRVLRALGNGEPPEGNGLILL